MTKKKIVVGCDGTWLNSDSGVDSSYWPWSSPNKGTLVTPSNVTRMCRALSPRSSPGLRKHGRTDRDYVQVVDYEPGIGSASNPWDHFVNGATADSIGENMAAGYRAVVNKWERGDEIFLIGFSRGAFIARSIAAMIRYVGLLNKKGMEYFHDVFADWENQDVKGYRQKRYPGATFKEVGNSYCGYAKQLELDGLTRLDVRIKAVAVWDTVGSLGVPTIDSLPIPTFGMVPSTRPFAFVDTRVLSNVDNCFHAIALDEHRKPFSPTLWEQPPDSTANPPCNLKQCWFPGVHGNIGGSVDDANIPNIALAWMTAQLSPFLDFDTDYLQFCRDVNLQWYTTNHKPERKWGMGYIEETLRGLIMILGGSRTRAPGRMFRTSPTTGQPTRERLQGTNETVHPCVRVRRWDWENGKGFDDQGPYRPRALEGFELQGEKRDEGDPLSEGWKWVMKHDPVTGGDVVLEEVALKDVEKMLLGAMVWAEELDSE